MDPSVFLFSIQVRNLADLTLIASSTPCGGFNYGARVNRDRAAAAREAHSLIHASAQALRAAEDRSSALPQASHRRCRRLFALVPRAPALRSVEIGDSVLLFNMTDTYLAEFTLHKKLAPAGISLAINLFKL
ncbi:hypothetical protein AURDEDRAFT_166689 [Auricularia subglabra TFB-10046 SS5]|nr:hypothetical protein AURDEDRAFT_166689 [Auricularia subglabra TFB-10046 SS5]